MAQNSFSKNRVSPIDAQSPDRFLGMGTGMGRILASSNRLVF
jgi:hypothetical protein